MADVFVSYKKKDRERVIELVQALESVGFTVWWDYEIESGDDWLNAILKEVSIARCVVGAWTPNAVAPNGMFVPSEKGVNYIRIEHEEGAAKLAPALLEGDALPIQFRDVQFSDLRSWRADQTDHPGFQALVARIEELATPSWVSAKIKLLEAKLAQTGERLRAQELLTRTLNDTLSAGEYDRVKELTEAEKQGFLRGVDSVQPQIKALQDEIKAAHQQAEKQKEMALQAGSDTEQYGGELKQLRFRASYLNTRVEYLERLQREAEEKRKQEFKDVQF